MNDTPSQQHAHLSRQLRRLRRLTIASLVVNGLVLLLILGALLHHHRRPERRGDDGRGDPGGRFGRERSDGDMPGGGFHRHHHEMMMERDGGWGRPDGDRGGDGGRPHRGFGEDHQNRDFQDGPGGPPPEMGGMEDGRHGAGGPPDPAKMTDRLMERLSRELALTEDEKTKIKPIVSQAVTDFEKAAADRRDALQKQIADTKTRIKPLLTPDQQKQLDALPVPGPR